ncbi:MAG: peptidoglycan-binding protein [Aestuariivirgaceae bacterium]|nr:peptidoglycan-binding protein [Aestuariivirgaceae bacterium]
MIPIDSSFILNVAPKFSGVKAQAQTRIVSAIGPVFAATLDSYAINTALRIAHFMGQVTHECAGFRTTEEFASGAAYQGRKDLGNLQPGDGIRYKGRGLIQLTGRHNYKDMGKKLGLPLENSPQLAGDPVTSLKIACEYWKSRKINEQADKDDLLICTKLVNGGKNGLEDRRLYLQKAKMALAEIQATITSSLESGTGAVLRRGSHNDAVGELQALLQKNGYPVAIDDDFGAATEQAVRMFQKAKKMVADGIVGAKTWTALRLGAGRSK